MNSEKIERWHEKKALITVQQLWSHAAGNDNIGEKVRFRARTEKRWIYGELKGTSRP